MLLCASKFWCSEVFPAPSVARVALDQLRTPEIWRTEYFLSFCKDPICNLKISNATDELHYITSLMRKFLRRRAIVRAQSSFLQMQSSFGTHRPVQDSTSIERGSVEKVMWCFYKIANWLYANLSRACKKLQSFPSWSATLYERRLIDNPWLTRQEFFVLQPINLNSPFYSLAL